MRHWILGLAVVFAAASAAAADEKAEAVVKKAIEAHGGAAALDKYKAGKSNMKGEMTLPMLGDVAFSGKVAYMSPDKYKLDIELEIMGQKLVATQVVNGDKVKNKLTLGGMALPIPDDQKEDLKLVTALQEAESLTPLLDAKKF
jgi:hypothetical protein